jgi:hypothetical protein
MSKESGAQKTSLRLQRLLEDGELSKSDRFLAEQYLRRLEKPLRLTIFGTDPKHAISLLNLMIGQPVVSPSLTRARIQFFHSETTHARLQFRDGSQERIDGSEFRRLFDDNPSRVRIYVDLPVLKKLSIMVAAEANPNALCSDVEKTMPAADIALWTGAELVDPMSDVWHSVPSRLRDHSYLVLSETMEMDSWQSIADEFVDVFRVDPRRAQEAKSREGGVDKAAFKDSGGAQIVRTIKKEIDVLVQAAMDASEVMLIKYADQIDQAAQTEPTASAEAKEPVPTSEAGAPLKEVANSDVTTDSHDHAGSSPQMREQIYSVPLGKLASRSRMLKTQGQNANKETKPRTISMAIKNMPKKISRPVSQSSAKPRTRSRKKGAVHTPWSLGL